MTSFPVHGMSQCRNTLCLHRNTHLMGCCCSTDDDVPSAPDSTVRTYGGQQAFGGMGHALGGRGVDSTSGIDARNAAAAAAIEREHVKVGAGASERDRKLAERRQKDDLIGKINAYYSQLHKDPPIGLAASTVEQLRKHLDHVKREAGKHSTASAITVTL